MTTRTILTAILLAILPLSIIAQPQPQQHNWPQAQQRNWPQRMQPSQQPRFDPEKFQQDMLARLIKDAGLTPAEAQAFTPLYKEMREKQRAIAGQIHELKTKKYSSEKEYLNALTKIKSLQVEQAEVEANYYKRICKVIGAEKLFKLMLAEDRFHRQMVRGGNQNWNNNNNRRQWGQKREK